MSDLRSNGCSSVRGVPHNNARCAIILSFYGIHKNPEYFLIPGAVRVSIPSL